MAGRKRINTIIVLQDLIAADIYGQYFNSTTNVQTTQHSDQSELSVESTKIRIKLWLNMASNGGPLSAFTTKPCWWCRHSFSSSPVGCPLFYYPHDSPGLDIIRQKFAEMNYSLEHGCDYFDCEGNFCSFSCVKSYILDEMAKSKSDRYANALTLLSLLYFKIHGRVKSISPAPTWKVIDQYGGHASIEEYRSTFDVLEYNETVNYYRPWMFLTSQYIQERVKDTKNND
jgi:hypothetical protein